MERDSSTFSLSGYARRAIARLARVYVRYPLTGRIARAPPSAYQAETPPRM
jgi:hypothetical protein